MTSLSYLAEESFTCSVCHELLRDPVAIPCGHHFCMMCIRSWWDQEDGKGQYSCALCSHTFDSRPVLNKKHLIAEMVEMFRKTSIQVAAPARCYVGPGDVACDICTGRKLKAVKSCLECLKSYCDTHLKAHNELIGRNHTMVDATGQLQERICPRHKKVFEIFCRTDQSCICYLCMMDDHKSHDTVTATAEWSNKKNMVSIDEDQESAVTRRTFSQSHFFEPLKESVSALKMQLEEKLDSISKQEIVKIPAAGDAVLTRGMGMRMRMRMRMVCVFVCVLACVVSLHHMISTAEPEPEPDPVTREDFLKSCVVSLPHMISTAGPEPDPDPVTREDFLKYSCYFTLDPNTTHCCLRMPEGDRVVLGGWWPGGGRGRQPRPEDQAPPDHPDRFDGQWYQVLCREGVSAARCYWEVEWSGPVGIAVSYKSISRKGDGNECGFGGNEQSWSLDVGSRSFIWHNNRQKGLGVAASSRIGVYVDHRAGTLAFYSISRDTMTLMHRVNSTFTQALYPGFRLYCSPLSTPSSPSSSVKLL